MNLCVVVFLLLPDASALTCENILVGLTLASWEHSISCWDSDELVTGCPSAVVTSHFTDVRAFGDIVWPGVLRRKRSNAYNLAAPFSALFGQAQGFPFLHGAGLFTEHLQLLSGCIGCANGGVEALSESTERISSICELFDVVSIAFLFGSFLYGSFFCCSFPFEQSTTCQPWFEMTYWTRPSESLSSHVASSVTLLLVSKGSLRTSLCLFPRP